MPACACVCVCVCGKVPDSTSVWIRNKLVCVVFKIHHAHVVTIQAIAKYESHVQQQRSVLSDCRLYVLAARFYSIGTVDGAGD